MKIAATISAAALVVSASFAFAGSIAAPTLEEEPMAPIAPLAPASDWSGFYGGLQYSWADIELSTPNGSASVDGDGFGLHAGYLHDFDKLVLGGELDYSWLDVEGIDADLLRVKALAGYDFGRFLPYLTVGYANADLSDGLGSDNGVSYGLGGMFKVTEDILLGLEYTRNDFDDFENSGIDVEADLIQLRASYHF